MFKELLFEYNTIVELGGFLLIVTGMYWKLRIDIKVLDLKIEEIKCDRTTRWSAYDEKMDKQDAYLADIMRGIEDVKGDVKSIKTDLSWLKRK